MISKNEMKRKVKKNEQIIKNQQALIGGKRVDWSEVENWYVFDDVYMIATGEIESWSHRIGDACDVNKLRFLPKPIVVTPRQKGLTSTGESHNCHSNVIELVNRFGGSHIMGWELSHHHGTIVLNHHSIWKTPEHEFVDVTQLSALDNEYPRQNPFLFIPLVKASDNLWVSFYAGKICLKENYVGVISDLNEQIVPAEELRFRKGKTIKEIIYGCNFEFRNYGYRDWELEESSFNNNMSFVKKVA